MIETNRFVLRKEGVRAIITIYKIAIAIYDRTTTPNPPTPTQFLNYNQIMVGSKLSYMLADFDRMLDQLYERLSVELDMIKTNRFILKNEGINANKVLYTTITDI